jgi:calcium-dependent protein kinase
MKKIIYLNESDLYQISNRVIEEQELDEIMKRIDLDNNECIEYEEFIRSTVSLDLLLTEDNLKLVFKSFDKDGSGLLTPNEIKAALGLIDSEDSELIKKIISEIDSNGDGDISFPEFKNLMINVLKQ